MNSTGSKMNNPERPDHAIPFDHCACCEFYGMKVKRSLFELVAFFDTHGANINTLERADDAIPIVHCPCCKYYGVDENNSLCERMAIFDAQKSTYTTECAQDDQEDTLIDLNRLKINMEHLSFIQKPDGSNISLVQKDTSQQPMTFSIQRTSISKEEATNDDDKRSLRELLAFYDSGGGTIPRSLKAQRETEVYAQKNVRYNTKAKGQISGESTDTNVDCAQNNKEETVDLHAYNINESMSEIGREVFNEKPTVKSHVAAYLSIIQKPESSNIPCVRNVTLHHPMESSDERSSISQEETINNGDKPSMRELLAFYDTNGETILPSPLKSEMDTQTMRRYSSDYESNDTEMDCRQNKQTKPRVKSHVAAYLSIIQKPRTSNISHDQKATLQEPMASSYISDKAPNISQNMAIHNEDKRSLRELLAIYDTHGRPIPKSTPLQRKSEIKRYSHQSDCELNNTDIDCSQYKPSETILDLNSYSPNCTEPESEIEFFDKEPSVKSKVAAYLSLIQKSENSNIPLARKATSEEPMSFSIISDKSPNITQEEATYDFNINRRRKTSSQTMVQKEQPGREEPKCCSIISDKSPNISQKEATYDFNISQSRMISSHTMDQPARDIEKNQQESILEQPCLDEEPDEMYKHISIHDMILIFEHLIEDSSTKGKSINRRESSIKRKVSAAHLNTSNLELDNHCFSVKPIESDHDAVLSWLQPDNQGYTLDIKGDDLLGNSSSDIQRIAERKSSQCFPEMNLAGNNKRSTEHTEMAAFIEKVDLTEASFSDVSNDNNAFGVAHVEPAVSVLRIAERKCSQGFPEINLACNNKRSTEHTEVAAFIEKLDLKEASFVDVSRDNNAFEMAHVEPALESFGSILNDEDDIEMECDEEQTYEESYIVEALGAKPIPTELDLTYDQHQPDLLTKQNESTIKLDGTEVEGNKYDFEKIGCPFEPIVIRPSVVPFDNFNCLEDVIALRKATKGLGTDERKLINILCKRSNVQLREIQCKYLIQYGRELYKDVHSDTSYNFRVVLCSLLLPRYLFYTNQLRDAFSGLGTDDDTLVDILCTLSHPELVVVQKKYYSIYNRSLRDDIRAYTSGLFHNLLISLCMTTRDECPVDPKLVHSDAHDVIAWPEKRPGVDDYIFNQILTQRSFAHIRALNQCCLDRECGALLDIVEGNFKGDIKNALSAIVIHALDRPFFFATRLHKSMARVGTNDTQLIRIMIMRCEIDLEAVARVFELTYKNTLASFIKGDTSGDYRDALLALLGDDY